MKFNHYYKELNLSEYDFPFEKNEDILDRNIEDEEGFTATEFFSLDYSLALYIYGRLRYFQDHCMVGHPACMTMEKWEEILKKIIKSFKLYIEEETIDYTKSQAERLTLSKNRQKQINYGFRLFIKYFGNLWY